MRCKGLRLFLVVFMITTFVLHTDRRRAEAILPVALAPAAPYLLAALVGGTTALWCYTHGGKEAWIQAYGATLDGVAVTKQWIQEKIAQNHGINTEVSSDTFPSGAGTVTFNGINYSVTGYVDTNNVASPAFPLYFVKYTANMTPVENWSPGYNMMVVKSGPTTVRRYWISSTVSPVIGPASNFDPADYPELYTGPALLSNCHAVAQQNPGLVIAYNDWTPEEPETPVPPVYVPPVHIVATLPDGSTVDNEGKVWPPPPGNPWVWPGAVAPPAAVPGTVGGVPVQLPGMDQQTVALPQNLIDQLRDAGLPEDAVITGAGAGHITYKDPTDGKEKYMPIPAETAAQLPAAIAKASASAEGIEMGDIGVPDLPEQSSFNSTFAYNQPGEWNWTQWMNNPFQSVIDSMKIETSAAQSQINFPVNLGFTEFVVSADFADHSDSFSTIGGFMVIMSSIMAIMLVIKK